MFVTTINAENCTIYELVAPKNFHIPIFTNLCYFGCKRLNHPMAFGFCSSVSGDDSVVAVDSC